MSSVHSAYYEENGDVFRRSDGLPMVIDGACIAGSVQGFDDWFKMDDWFFLPNNDDRICKFDHTWYNVDEAWRMMQHSNLDEESLKHWQTILGSLLHGMLFNDAYKVRVMDTHFRVRVDSSIRELIHDALEPHKMRSAMAQHYLTLIRDFGHTLATRAYEDDHTIDTFEVDSLTDEEIDGLFNAETFFDDISVIDLTTSDD